MANTINKPVTLIQKIWNYQVLLERINKALNIVKVLGGKVLIPLALWSFSIGLIVLPIVIFFYSILVNSLLILSPLLLACVFCGIICYNVLTKKDLI